MSTISSSPSSATFSYSATISLLISSLIQTFPRSCFRSPTMTQLILTSLSSWWTLLWILKLDTISAIYYRIKTSSLSPSFLLLIYSLQQNQVSVTKICWISRKIYRCYFGWLFHLSCPKKLIDFIDGSLKFSITFFRILIALAWPSFHHNPFNNNWNECYFQINFLLSNLFWSGYKASFIWPINHL